VVPPAASSSDLSSLTLPAAERSKPTQADNSLKLKSGFVIEQAKGVATYTLDGNGRITEVRFPDGYTVAGISYHTQAGHEERIAQLTITSGSGTKTYKRNSYGADLYLSWKVSAAGAAVNSTAPDFEGDFSLTPCGEFVTTDFSSGSNNRILRTPDGRIHTMRQLKTGAYFYMRNDGLPFALRRTDLSLISITYSEKTPTLITEEFQGSPTRSWRFDAASKSWLCSDPAILPSNLCPLFEKGTLSFVRGDGARVSIATSGAATILAQDGVTTVLDCSGKITRVAKGARSRLFNYNRDGELLSFCDKLGSLETLTHIKPDPSIQCRIEQNGAVRIVAIQTAGQAPAPLAVNERFGPPFSSSATNLPTFPNMQIHPHDPKKGDLMLCKSGVCPTTPAPRDQIGVFVPTDQIAIGQESLITNEISTWTTLDQIEKHRGGTLAPVVEFLRIWAATTSDEDIDTLTSPEALRLLQGDGSIAWLQPELLSPTNADYLFWLRDCIRANKLPCTLDVKPLSYPGLTNQALFGGVTDHYVSTIDRSLRISVDIQSLTYSELEIRADISEMLRHGGTGIYRPTRFQSASVFNTLFHELQHVFVYSTGREFEGTEPTAHLGAFLALASITPEKAKRYEGVLKRFKR
jgi:hypothetical protein